MTGGAPTPAAKRLGRLRITLTVFFTAALAVGLLVLSAVAVRTDSRLRSETLESDMSQRVAGSARLIYYTNDGRLKIDGLRDDDLTVGSPEIRVFLGTGDQPREIFRSRGPHLPLDQPPLDALSREAVVTEAPVRSTMTDQGGQHVRLVAAPFYNDATEKPAGAVISAASLEPSDDDHRQLVLTLGIGCAALLVLAAGAGYLLAGRSLRPAARGLEQQEALLADAAHELRTPVASIRAQLEAAQLDPSTRDTAIENAVQTSRRMGDTVSTLLARARLEAGTEPPVRSELRLDQLVEEVVADQSDDGRITLSAEPVVVSGDPQLLRIAARNLIENALRHGGDAVPVEVGVAGGALTVSDRGPGYPAEVLEEGIARFRAGSSNGTGLGLSIADWIAEVHGGRLELRDRDGGGAVATLTL